MPNIQRIAEFNRPTIFGQFKVISYNSDGNYAFAIMKGEFPKNNLLVRVHSACLFGESFGVTSCDCGGQLNKALEIGSKESPFLLVYLPFQEGRGLGLSEKIKEIEVQDNQKVDTVEAAQSLGQPLDVREYQVAAEIIKDINSNQSICLMTNNPRKIKGLQDNGVTIENERRLYIDNPSEECKRYLAAKKNKMGHLLPDYL
jgi:3,4-dihydroxy 2-butanone 4-phosphate synthase/GTP cyclohydrolase II